jgi:RNA polymerase sigma factor (sigma-70 family)
MPPAMDDAKLLEEFAANQSEEAFRILVDRHVSLVYHAALRKVGNPSLAEDVTQTVFIILARKAKRLSKTTILSGWLYRTTCFTASKAVRTEFRRRQREQDAVQLQIDSSDSTWTQLSPVLEESMSRLREADQTIVLLRFFENKDLKEVGRILGISEDTAETGLPLHNQTASVACQTGRVGFNRSHFDLDHLSGHACLAWQNCRCCYRGRIGADCRVNGRP